MLRFVLIEAGRLLLGLLGAALMRRCHRECGARR